MFTMVTLEVGGLINIAVLMKRVAFVAGINNFSHVPALILSYDLVAVVI